MEAVLAKRCGKCGEEKPTADFYKKSRESRSEVGLAALTSNCRVCVKARSADWRKRNPVICRDGYRDSSYRFNYGITLQDYNVMFESQQGRCAICSRHQTEFKRTLGVDHCHKTGKVRGLLCTECNVGIARFHDDTRPLENAIAYLMENTRKDG